MTCNCLALIWHYAVCGKQSFYLRQENKIGGDNVFVGLCVCLCGCSKQVNQIVGALNANRSKTVRAADSKFDTHTFLGKIRTWCLKICGRGWSGSRDLRNFWASNAYSSKTAKLRTSNMIHMLAGTVRSRSLRIYGENAWSRLDPSAAEWRRHRQRESSGAVAAEKQTKLPSEELVLQQKCKEKKENCIIYLKDIIRTSTL